MKNRDFTTKILLQEPPRKVFAAIKNVADWWSGEFTGSADRVGDEFTYRYKDFHVSRQRVTELVENRKIVWRVVDSSLNFVAHKNEWNGTDITFEIARKGDQTELRFTHVGLGPEHECYGACSNGWTSLISGNLRSLITAGKAISLEKL